MKTLEEKIAYCFDTYYDGQLTLKELERLLKIEVSKSVMEWLQQKQKTNKETCAKCRHKLPA